jgi:pyrroloquinoline-quinone synthase
MSTLAGAYRHAPITAQIDALTERFDFLRHPFYEAWTEGRLSREDLARYAEAYRWPVLALAALAELAVDPEHAREEYAHVTLWEQFARGCGARRREPPAHGASCALVWLAGTDRLERLAALYAIESVQPLLAATKLAALRRHYGFEEGGTTEYFTIHATRDFVHAAATRAEIERAASPRDGRRLVARARAVLAANWQLLDALAVAA